MRMRLSSLLTWVRRRPLLALVLGLLLAVLGFVGHRAVGSFRVQQHLAAAERATVHYDFEEAERHLTDCLQLQPHSAALHLRMARVARRANHFELAEQHLRKCREIEGRNQENALESLLLRAQSGDIADTERLLLEQVNLGSSDTNQILEALAQGYVHIYHPDAAMGCLNRLLKREPNNVSALLLRASLWNTAGNFSGAEEDCRRAVKAQPEHRKARLRFGESLLLSKQPQEALRQYEYLRQHPDGDDVEVLLGLARCHRRLGDLPTARRLLEEVLGQKPHQGSALIERGQIALEIESPAAAEKWFRQAAADYPFDPQSKYLLAQALRKQGREAEAREYETVRARLEDDLKALQSAFQQVVKDPTAAGPRLQAGLICLRNGRDDEGERWLLSALEQVPEHAATRAALAAFYQRTGRTDLAELYRRPLSKGSSGPSP